MAKWVKEFREKFGLSKQQLADCVPCSEVLIGIIENPDGKGITHPLIANKIATICGATAEQRDEIVHEKWRGTWQPGEKKSGKKAAAWKPGAVRPVVKIDPYGREMARYPSVDNAAKCHNTYGDKIAAFCRRQLANEKKVIEDFGGCIFRYADEWDAEQKLRRENEFGAVMGR